MTELREPESIVTETARARTLEEYFANLGKGVVAEFTYAAWPDGDARLENKHFKNFADEYSAVNPDHRRLADFSLGAVDEQIGDQSIRMMQIRFVPRPSIFGVTTETV